MANGGKTDLTISAIISGFTGLILLTALLPTMVDIVGNLTGKAADYAPILYLIPLCMAIGIVIGFFKIYNGGSR